MITTGKLLGFTIVVLVLMAMHQQMIPLSSPTSDKLFKRFPNLLKIKKKMAAFMLKGHRLFGILAVSVALVHGAYNSLQGNRSLTGILVLVLLSSQAALGYLARRNHAWFRYHKVLPYLGLFALVFHILVK